VVDTDDIHGYAYYKDEDMTESLDFGELISITGKTLSMFSTLGSASVQTIWIDSVLPVLVQGVDDYIYFDTDTWFYGDYKNNPRGPDKKIRFSNTSIQITFIN